MLSGIGERAVDLHRLDVVPAVHRVVQVLDEVGQSRGYGCRLRLDLHHGVHLLQVLLHLDYELVHLVLLLLPRESHRAEDVLGRLDGQLSLRLHLPEVGEHHVRVRELELPHLLHRLGQLLGAPDGTQVRLREPVQGTQVLKDADGLAAHAVIAEHLVDIATHRAELIAQMRQLPELVEHVVHLLGGVGGRCRDLAGVDDDLLCGSADAEDKGAYQCAEPLHRLPSVSFWMASIGDMVRVSSRNSCFLPLFDS